MIIAEHSNSNLITHTNQASSEDACGLFINRQRRGKVRNSGVCFISPLNNAILAHIKKKVIERRHFEVRHNITPFRDL